MMKAELSLPPELVDEIAEKVVEKMKPLFARNYKVDTENSLLTTEELCKYLGVSRKWVYDRTRLKEIPHIKRGNKLLLFDKKDIDKWISTFKIPDVDSSESILKAIKQG